MGHVQSETTEELAWLRAENRLLRRYLGTLGDIALAGELPLPDLLQRIVEIARDLLHARYAALGVLDGHGRVTALYTAGLSAEERAAIPHLPVGAGLLGYIIRERRIVRCRRIADHPASVGFPPNHPVMTSFIGGPIARGEVVYGNLYLTDRIGAEEFSPEDAELLDLLARQSAVAIENAQRFARARREEQTTRALFEIGKALSALAEPRAVIETAVRAALDLLGAEVAGLALREDEPSGAPRISWAVLRGSLFHLREGAPVPAGGSLVGQVFETGIPLVLDDLSTRELTAGTNPLLDQEGIASLVLVPLGGEARPRGVLMVGWRAPGAVPDGAGEVLARLADRVAIALAQAELRAREQAALRQSETERLSLEAIFDSLRDAIVTTDLAERVVRLNHQAARWAGADVTGRPISEVFRLLSEKEEHARSRAPASRAGEDDVVLMLPSGEQIPVEHISAPIRDATGEVRGAVHVFRDLRPQREVEQLKANIISLVSHELRTPLSHIKGYASSLLQPDVEWDPETQRDFIASIERQADRLARLISDLLEISRLDAGGTARLEPVAVAPATLIERGLRQAEPFLGNHPITVDLASDLPLVRADPSHLERVLSNLVENAAKYSPDGAPIRINVTYDPPQVTFAVADCGPGLTADEKAHLFERFYRSPRVKHRTPGTGLGLAICKEIIQAHGGQIWAESVEGHGSTFRFTLPLAD
jgi:PAS domain S-box-containing protein